MIPLNRISGLRRLKIPDPTIKHNREIPKNTVLTRTSHILEIAEQQFELAGMVKDVKNSYPVLSWFCPSVKAE
jgi:hypothetical protein